MSSEGWPCFRNACSAGFVTAFLLPPTTCTPILLGLVAKPAFPRINFCLESGERGVCVTLLWEGSLQKPGWEGGLCGWRSPVVHPVSRGLGTQLSRPVAAASPPWLLRALLTCELCVVLIVSLATKLTPPWSRARGARRSSCMRWHPPPPPSLPALSPCCRPGSLCPVCPTVPPGFRPVRNSAPAPRPPPAVLPGCWEARDLCAGQPHLTTAVPPTLGLGCPAQAGEPPPSWGLGGGGESLLALLDCDSGQCPHLDIQPWPWLGIWSPLGSRLTMAAYSYSAAHVRSGKKVGVRGIHKTLTLLSLFPQTCLSNNRQCALQQSRNQAGHRLLSSSWNHRDPSSQPQSLCSLHPLPPWVHRECLLFGEGQGGEKPAAVQPVQPCLPGAERLGRSTDLLVLASQGVGRGWAFTLPSWCLRSCLWAQAKKLSEQSTRSLVSLYVEERLSVSRTPSPRGLGAQLSSGLCSQCFGSRGDPAHARGGPSALAPSCSIQSSQAWWLQHTALLSRRWAQAQHQVSALPTPRGRAERGPGPSPSPAAPEESLPQPCYAPRHLAPETLKPPFCMAPWLIPPSWACRSSSWEVSPLPKSPPKSLLTGVPCCFFWPQGPAAPTPSGEPWAARPPRLRLLPWRPAGRACSRMTCTSWWTTGPGTPWVSQAGGEAKDTWAMRSAHPSCFLLPVRVSLSTGTLPWPPPGAPEC